MKSTSTKRGVGGGDILPYASIKMIIFKKIIQDDNINTLFRTRVGIVKRV